VVIFAGRPVEGDITPGRWIADAVRADSTVGSLVPPVFEAYARVFHPAARYVGNDDVDVPWAEVAAANATVAHPGMEWGSITGLMEFFDQADQSPLWDGAPARGHLPAHVAQAMARVLRGHTGTPEDCWLGVPAELIPAELIPAELLRAGTQPLELGGNQFWLIRAPIESAAANLAEEPSEQSAGIWWPADRAWFVGTDIDLVTTYVGGSTGCIADLLAAGGLETAPADAAQAVTWDADRVNPLPPDGPADR
jgi:hypothetical protein